MSAPLRGISSMATRQLLAELAAMWQHSGGVPISIESVGGVDAARRVQAGEGEAFDLVFLASDAIDKLIAAGHLLAGSKVDLVHSSVAVAVRAGAQQPDLSTSDAVRRAVLAAPSVGYSTGPSGTALLKLFDRWGIAPQMQSRLVQAPAGTPVGTLVAQGDVALGFQQLSELMHLPSIDIAGQLPPDIQITTTFSGGIAAGSARTDDARRVLHFMGSGQADAAKRRQGMVPAGEPNTSIQETTA